jgi:tRNA G18 (ribose-2'-O)-methylase SpoU
MTKTPVILILHDIRSTLNVGAIFRTADAANIEKIYLTGYTATPEHPKVPKTSLGAENYVPWEKDTDVKKLIKRLKSEGIQIVGLELHHKAVNFWKAAYRYPLAVIIGNEVTGIPDDLIDLCDMIIKIPMAGKKESLNAATATGIAVFEISKRFIDN